MVVICAVTDLGQRKITCSIQKKIVYTRTIIADLSLLHTV